jgi:hypothetical protein
VRPPLRRRQDTSGATSKPGPLTPHVQPLAWDEIGLERGPAPLANHGAATEGTGAPFPLLTGGR